MDDLLALSERAQAQLAAALSDRFQFKKISGRRGDFGDLEGFEFNAERCGGFLYFWSDGNCEFQLVDYVRSVEVIPFTRRMIATAADADEILGKLGQAALHLVAPSA